MTVTSKVRRQKTGFGFTYLITLQHFWLLLFEYLDETMGKHAMLFFYFSTLYQWLLKDYQAHSHRVKKFISSLSMYCLSTKLSIETCKMNNSNYCFVILSSVSDYVVLLSQILSLYLSTTYCTMFHLLQNVCMEGDNFELSY